VVDLLIVAVVVLGVIVAVLSGVLVRMGVERNRRAADYQEELRQLLEGLEQLVTERDQLAIEAVRAESLERFEEQRSALLRAVSHDLRTPLSAIRAVASDLRDGVVYDDPTRIELLDTVCDEADRLDRLVANLLSMGRIEAGVFEANLQAVDLRELVEDRAKRLSPLLKHVRVRYDLPDDLPLVHGDYGQLEQLLTNLLSNAARHAPNESDVWVLARSKEDDADTCVVQVEVSDQGEGIDPQDRERVFEPFQVGKGSRSTGIGLAICRAIVEAHGGRIWIERTFGGGATFVFTLPCLPLDASSAPAEVES
jgi:two-component system sensor histidine kinase KdpD